MAQVLPTGPISRIVVTGHGLHRIYGIDQFITTESSLIEVASLSNIQWATYVTDSSLQTAYSGPTKSRVKV